jgi:hypothetical protein
MLTHTTHNRCSAAETACFHRTPTYRSAWLGDAGVLIGYQTIGAVRRAWCLEP